MEDTHAQSLGREDPLEEEMAATPVSLPGESLGQRSLMGYIPCILHEPWIGPFALEFERCLLSEKKDQNMNDF